MAKDASALAAQRAAVDALYEAKAALQQQARSQQPLHAPAISAEQANQLARQMSELQQQLASAREKSAKPSESAKQDDQNSGQKGPQANGNQGSSGTANGQGNSPGQAQASAAPGSAPKGSGQSQRKSIQQTLGDLAQQMQQLKAGPSAPPGLAQALTAAQKAIADADAQATADPSRAQAAAAAAASALAQAQAAIVQAQSGIAMEPDHSQQIPPMLAGGGTPGADVSPQQATVMGTGENIANGTGGSGRALASAAGRAGGRYTGLPSRDRQVLEQSQADRYPSAYSAMVEQYRRNLASESP